MIPYYIYGLLNPITNQYFYVGATGQDLRKRLNGHMSSTDKNIEKVAVIKGLLNYGERPKIVLLETVYNFDECPTRELFWINKLKYEGNPLTNKSYNTNMGKVAKNPKVQITIYVTEETIAKFGGVEQFKEAVYKFINDYEPELYENPNYIKSSLEEM